MATLPGTLGIILSHIITSEGDSVHEFEIQSKDLHTPVHFNMV